MVGERQVGAWAEHGNLGPLAVLKLYLCHLQGRLGMIQ